MDITDLEKSIIKTCAFFDLFDYPLTLLEIKQWLIDDADRLAGVSLAQVYDCLDQSEFLKTKLSQADGFYFLAGREAIGATRLRRYSITQKKYRLARRGLSALAALPFVGGVFLCNNFGYNNLHSRSDIDIFLTVAPGRIFLVRLLATLAIAVLGLRPSKTVQTDRLCLSFYLTSDALDFSELKIVANDLYLSYWLNNLLPVYGNVNLPAANPWLKQILPNFSPLIPAPQRLIQLGRLRRDFKRAAAWLLRGRLGNRLEAWNRRLQSRQFSPAKKNLAKMPDSRVLIGDHIIKLHENDRRRDYLDRWQEKINSLLSDART